MEPAIAVVMLIVLLLVVGGIGIWLLVRPKKEEEEEEQIDPPVAFASPPAAPAAAAPIYLSYPEEAPSRSPVQVRTSDAKVVVVPPPAAPPVSTPLPLMVPTFSQPVISAPRPPSVQVVGFPTTQPPAIPLQVKPKGKCGLGTTWDSGKKICRAPKTPVVAGTTTAAAPKKGGCAEGRTWDEKQMKCRPKSGTTPGTPSSGKPSSSNKSKGCATGTTWDSRAGKCREVCGPGKSYNSSASKCIDKQSKYTLAGLRLADQLKKMKPDTPVADLEKIKAMRDSEVEAKRKELGLVDTKCNIGPTILFDYIPRVETAPGQKDWHCPVGWTDTGCDWGDAAGNSESRHCKRSKSEQRRMPVPGSSPGASIPSGSALIKAINAIGAIGDGFGAVLGGSDEAAHRLAAYNAST